MAAARRSDDGGFQKENKVTKRKHDHRKKKLGFPFWLLYHVKREKGESLIFIIFTEKTYYYITYWTYIVRKYSKKI